MKPYGLMIAAFLLVCVFSAGKGANAASYQVLHRFGDFSGEVPSANGISPDGLIVDKAGNFYGVTLYGGTTPNGCLCGTIFKLLYSQYEWIKTTLYSFTGGTEGTGPQPYLAMDKSGALYGEMGSGGDETCENPHGCGTVFKLTPPRVAGASWTFQVIHTFQNVATGSGPGTQLVIDPSGAIFGTTQTGGSSADCGCGAVFKLTPPETGRSAWTYNVLHTFNNEVNGSTPFGPLIEDASGALYGAASYGGAGYGTLFRLAPPADGQTLWTFSLLHTFKVSGNGYGVLALVLGQNGVVYGSAEAGGDNCPSSESNGCGTIFSLAPPSAGQEFWSYSVLHTFSPSGSVAMPDALAISSGGTLYGTTYSGGNGSCTGGCGVVFSLSPPPAGQKVWRYSLLQIIGHATNGAHPWGTIVLDPSGVELYGTTRWGGVSHCKNGQPTGNDAGCGVIYQLIE